MVLVVNGMVHAEKVATPCPFSTVSCFDSSQKERVCLWIGNFRQKTHASLADSDTS